MLQSQSDVFIAGRGFEAHQLGLYSEALFLTLIVTGRFLPPINDVAFPAYAELHKAGHSLAPYFVRTPRTVLLVTAPIYRAGAYCPQCDPVCLRRKVDRDGPVGCRGCPGHAAYGRADRLQPCNQCYGRPADLTRHQRLWRPTLRGRLPGGGGLWARRPGARLVVRRPPHCSQ
ncbi:oligosaccharide flippase family protein [Erythrobacter mangrovi]|uniref:Oligosaccharide flippase family protein n=1 Tax=Erythrobacter mangrovi TaxID=2739433 RepID=A0A7D3XJG5_9SPHN|nr:oligosaccharide flippase family protein [Erythrobacter mangrovi]